MKIFEQPKVNVIKFAVEDVITVSGETEAATTLPALPSAGMCLVGACI